MKKKHHELPRKALYLPSGMIAVSIILMLLGLRDIAFLLVGVMLATAVAIHYEER
jgi:hypothetical protein